MSIPGLMRRISEMYRRSGGCNYHHTCAECRYYRQRKKEETCFLLPDATWKGSWMACKFWQEPEIPEVQGQMRIEDVMKCRD